MRWFHDRSTLTKLLSGFAVVLVLAAAAAVAASLYLTVGLLACTIIAGGTIAFALAHDFDARLAIVRELADHMAQGDLTYDVGEKRRSFAAGNDGVGALTYSLGSMRAYLSGFEANARAIAEGDLTLHIELCSSADVLGKSFAAMVATLRDLVGQLHTSAVIVAETAGQLGSAASQTGSVVQHVSMALQDVANGAQQASRSAQETAAALDEFNQVLDDIARGATEQTRQVETTSATSSLMASGIEQVAASASQMATAGQQTRAAAEHGGQAVRETTAAMTEIQVVVGQAADKVRELGVLGQKIGAVVETIDDIAEQTNLLALNAAIEAARAGEHGKGFAVVADEVRKLAERSGRETKQIAELIAQVQTGTKEAVAAMDSGAAKVEFGSEKAAQAGEALDQILKAVKDTVRQVAAIASESQQMASGARSMTDAVQSISTLAAASSASTELMAAYSGEVTNSIQSIAAISVQQSAAVEQVSASTEQLGAHVEHMSAQAREQESTAEHLKELVARFKVGDEHLDAVRPHVVVTKMVTPTRRAA